MRPPLALLAGALVVSTLLAPDASAQAVHVPADYPTIQAALASGAATVYVAQGDYPESLLVTHTVTLLPEPPADPVAAIPFPRVAGLRIQRNTTEDVTVLVRGFHFTGPVSYANAVAYRGIATIEGCRLDAGFQTSGGSGPSDTIRLRGCTITGDVFVYAYHTDFSGNTVWKGTAQVNSNGYPAVVRDNLVIGPAALGIASYSPDTPCSVTGNTVSGTTVGFRVDHGTVSGNVAEDCGSHGFTTLTTWPPTGPSTYTNNAVRRCGGSGFDLHGITQTLSGNTVDSVGGAGIHAASGSYTIATGNVVRDAGAQGLWLESGLDATGNTVLRAALDGIRVSDGANGNVVGRSGGDGIVAATARGNTAYLNAGAGLVLHGAAGDSVIGNLAYGNRDYGLSWEGAGAPVLACNDWYGNVPGATHSVAPGATDLAVDPCFCDLAADDAHLCAASPLLGLAACGPIGALGVGCTSPAAVTPQPPGAFRLLARPNPAGGAVVFAWPGGPAPERIEVFDLAGARRFSVEPGPGASQVEWVPRGADGRVLPAGVYFARAVAGGRRTTLRLVLAR